MRYLVVAALSVIVGTVVYLVSLRGPREPAVGFEPAPFEPDEAPIPAREGPPPGYTYLQVPVVRGPSIGERIQGLLGSLALVALAALAVAGSLYSLGALLGRMLRSFVQAP